MVFLPIPESFSYDLASVCRKRYSPDSNFILGKVDQTQLSTLLKKTFSFLYHNDLDDEQGQIESRVFLYGSLYQVEGVPNGAYSYDHNVHGLRKITEGDYRGFFAIWINDAQCEYVSSSTLFAPGRRKKSP